MARHGIDRERKAAPGSRGGPRKRVGCLSDKVDSALSSTMTVLLIHPTTTTVCLSSSAMAATMFSSPLSSPFRESHRRTRSHTSLSTPSSSPVSRPHLEQWRGPTRRGPSASGKAPRLGDVSLIHPDVADQPPTKWDVDMWRRGKRPRRELPSMDVDADMESCDDEPNPLHSSGSFPSTSEVSTTSTTTIDAPLPPPMSLSSARLPCSSAAFNFFPTHRRPETQKSSASHVDSTDLSQLRGEAYSELRKSVAEAGEGFVKRMQALEEHRSQAEPSDTLLLPALACSFSTTSGTEDESSNLLRDHTALNKRGRKRPSPCSPPTNSTPFTATVKHITHTDAQPSHEDDDSDVEIYSSFSAPDDLPRWSPMKKRAVSLGGLELSYATSQLPQESLPSSNAAVNKRRKLPLSRRDRSSSPSDALDYLGSPSSASSGEESEDGSDIHLNLDTARHLRRRRFQSRRHHHSPSQSRRAGSGSGHSVESSVAPSLSFSFSSNSRNSSITSLPLGASSSAVPSADMGTPWRTALNFTTPPTTSPPLTASKTERAVAALTLALSNGAGSVSDYEALLAAQGVSADQQGEEAGDLWD